MDGFTDCWICVANPCLIAIVIEYQVVSSCEAALRTLKNTYNK
jgi:hypothetical protein